MPIVLIRVDERLIHGQVVVAWGSQLRPDRYLVVDETLAASEWEQELYTLGVPDRVAVEFIAPGQARATLPEWQESQLRSILLVRDLETVLELALGGALAEEEVNLGGIHSKPGRTEVLPYLFLDESDRAALTALAEQGVVITAQDLPGASKVGFDALLR